MKAFNPSKELKPKKYKKLKIAIPIIIAVIVSVMIGRSLANYSVHYELQVIDAVVGEFSKGKPAVEVVEGVTDTTKVAKDDPDKNPRYIGKNPDNYVTFNDETWRIIGVFNTYVCNDSITGKLDGYKSNSTCKQEKLLKIIKSDFLSTSIAWDSSNANDWSTASLQTTLNGDYFKKTGTYASNGLNPTAQGMVANVVWTLGGPGSDYTSKGTPSYFYTAERGDTVPSGNPKAFVGHVGLMFPSDYGYATGGGSTGRSACLAKEMYTWDSGSYKTDCAGGSWLYNSSTYQWTLSPRSDHSYNVFLVSYSGYVNGNDGANRAKGVRPVVYLKSSVQIVDGTGKVRNPYQLSYTQPIDEVLAAKADPNQIATDDPENNLRYIGASPNNYVKFNDENWRIIGVFNTYVCPDTTSGTLDTYSSTCKQEKLLKIIRKDFLSTSLAWDSSNANDWSTASLQKALNGEYFGRTGTYASNGLKAAAQSMVANVVWTLGGPGNEYSSKGTPSYFYTAERGDTVPSGRPKAFVGHVGLMYPSDYGYATGGGNTYNRTACLAKEMINWYGSSDCYNNDWLFNSSHTPWTLSPRYDDSVDVFYVDGRGCVNTFGDACDTRVVRPVVYLKSSVQIAEDGMDGSSGKPYNLSLYLAPDSFE